MSSNQYFTNQLKSIDPSSTDAPPPPPTPTQSQPSSPPNANTTTLIDPHTKFNTNTNTTTVKRTFPSCYNTNPTTTSTPTNTNTNTTTTTTIATTTDSNISVSVSASASASASVSSANSSSTSSSRRQRHSIAGQMSYMKMLGFGGFSKKMATSANSLFSTAVISGSSSAPNLRDMIPVSSSGFGDVPPIRPLETLHNALSLRKLDSFLQDMILAQIFKTPTGSPPRILHDTQGPMMEVSSMTLNAQSVSESTATPPGTTTTATDAAGSILLRDTPNATTTFNLDGSESSSVVGGPAGRSGGRQLMDAQSDEPEGLDTASSTTMRRAKKQQLD